jgi:hypothetical protein
MNRKIIVFTRPSFQKKGKGEGRPRTGYEGPEV